MFIKKEGFDQLIAESGMADRYDVAALMIATVRYERGLCRQADTGCVSSETDTRASVRHG